MKLRLPRKRRNRVLVYVTCGLLVAVAVDMVWVRVWRRVVVSEATTRITSPLRADGMPDYIQYLDNQVREGVTAENNAYIPFLEIATPMKTDAAGKPTEVFTGHFEKLGLTPPAGPQTVLDLLREGE